MDDLSTALRGVIRQAMGMPDNSVRPANQDAPAGGGTAVYATVDITDVADAGSTPERRNAVTQDVPDAVETTGILKVITASVNFWRGTLKDPANQPRWTLNGLEMASRLGQRLELEVNLQLLDAAGIGFLRSSRARNLAAVKDASWESRGQVDLTLTAWITDSAPIGTFVTGPTIGILVQTPAGAIETTNL